MSINAVHVTAARLRFGLNVKVYVRAAARDGKRYVSGKSKELVAERHRAAVVRL